MADTVLTTDETIRFIRIYIICRCLYLIVFAIGIIGNIFNLMVFFRKKFRSNSCSIYFIAYSINNFINLTVGLLIWSLTLGFDLDLEYRIVSYCKIRRYLTHANALISLCLLTMASINRYARVRQAQLTENRHRYVYLCERRTTYLIVVVTVLACLVVNIHIPLFFEIHDGECYAHSGAYRVVFDVFFLIFFAICPPLIMIAINIATVAHIRSIRRLVHPSVSRREYHLIVLVIAHSVSNIILTVPFSINKFVFYSFKVFVPTEKNQLINAITLLMFFMNPGLSFFLYTLTTKSFRQEFIRACKDLIFKINCCHNQNKSTNNEQQQRRNTNGSVLSLPLTELSKKSTL